MRVPRSMNATPASLHGRRPGRVNGGIARTATETVRSRRGVTIVVPVRGNVAIPGARLPVPPASTVPHRIDRGAAGVVGAVRASDILRPAHLRGLLFFHVY